jgi:hypothetical protein
MSLCQLCVCSVVPGVLVDPGDVGGGPGVDAGVVGPGAADAPRHDSAVLAAARQRAAGVALAMASNEIEGGSRRVGLMYVCIVGQE